MATVATATLALAACGGGSSGGGESSTGGEVKADAAVTGIVNPSDAAGGTLRIAQSGDWDSTDPADTYYAFSWNFLRLYGRTLVMFPPKAGEDGNKLVPDLATSLGKPSDDNKTWTYTLRDGVKFEDGTPVTSKDVKYGVERSLDKTTFPQGPTYFNDYLDLQGYTSPYKDKSADKLGLKAIETPDDKTIIFKLKKPFGGFDYFAQLPATVPVPQKKDTGTKYKGHVVSTGPYMFATDYVPGKGLTLKKNPNWSAATDPNRKQYVDNIDVAVNVNADDVDNRLLAGDLDIDLAGSGVQPAAQGKILQDPNLRKNSDIIPQARLNYVAIHPGVKPLDNIACRRAVEYATDKTGLFRAYGGSTGGEIASNITPPVIPGQQKFDTYATPNSAGDVAKAKAELAKCGQPNGFSTSLAYRGERPKEKAAAQSLQQSLGKAGIKLTLKSYPASDYFSLYAGNNEFVKKNNIGMNTMAWGADWNDGFGFLSQIVDPRVIRPSGNTNLGVTDPEVGTLVDAAVSESDLAKSQAAWVAVDKKVMDGAFIVPGTWGKGLYYRPANLTNVTASLAYGMYDYLNNGTTKK